MEKTKLILNYRSYETMKLIWIITALSLFPITIWYFIVFKKVTAQLGDKHPKIWKSLGQIGFIKNNTISNSNKMIMFLLKKEYQQLDDVELDREANKCRAILILGMTLTLMAFVMPILIGKYG